MENNDIVGLGLRVSGVGLGEIYGRNPDAALNPDL